LESPQTETPLTDSLEVKSMNNINNNKKKLAPEQREELLRVLKARFEKNMNRHKEAGEVFVTTVKPWNQGKNINQKIMLLIWQLPWALKF